MPDRSTYDIVEEDDGTFAETWATAGRVVEMDGVPHCGMTIDEADDVADRLEAIGRITAARGAGRVNRWSP